MPLHRLTDYDDAYANLAHIVDGTSWVARWSERAATFRASRPTGRVKLGLAYGASPRQRYDLFLPDDEPRGLAVFVHGGYWLRNDGAMWSHLAAGPLGRGFAVAIPTYRLAPEARVAEIAREVGVAIALAASQISGPIVLSGHSAGGQIVTRLACAPSSFAGRLAKVASISGVHDLRPLLRTQMRVSLRLDEAEARAESPALLEPLAGTKLVAWVGGAEQSEFRRQNALLANVWTGLGAATFAYEAPDRHHFNVVEDLAEPESGLTAALIG